MLPASILLAAAVIYRVVLGVSGPDHSWLPNFAPVAAIALCGPCLFPRRHALVLPVAILLVSDLVLNRHHGVALVTGEMLARYGVLLGIAAAGLRLARDPRLATLLPAGLVGSVAFFLVTNTASWLGSPGYPGTLAGWCQALTVGLPGYPPTWVFLRNSLAGDAFFTVLFVACLVLSRQRTARAVPAAGAAGTGDAC